MIPSFEMIDLCRMPEANILKSEVIKDSTAPIVASFSSRGPNLITLDIMKVIVPQISLWQIVFYFLTC